MNVVQRKEIIATLITQGRPDLANLIALRGPTKLSKGQRKALDLAIKGLEQTNGNLRALGKAYDQYVDRVESIVDDLETLKKYW